MSNSPASKCASAWLPESVGLTTAQDVAKSVISPITTLGGDGTNINLVPNDARGPVFTSTTL